VKHRVLPWGSRAALLLGLVLGLGVRPVPLRAQAPADSLRRETLSFDGITAELAWRLPRAAGPRPLILALHYGGKPTPYYGEGLIERLVGPAFRELDALIVAPTCPDGGWARPRCEAIALHALDHALATHPVDRSRVLVTGFSMGGMGTWHFATRFPERFSAALPVAGRPLDDALPAIPVWALHSTADEVIPIEPARAALARLAERDPRAHFEVIDGVTHHTTADFAEPLARAVPWLRALWAAEPTP